LSLSPVLRRGLAATSVLAASLTLGACSSGGDYADRSDYVSPIAVSSAPRPTVPSASGGSAGRRPLLPPVPEEQGSNGLPPVAMATLLPPPVR